MILVLKEVDVARKLIFTWNGAQWRTTFDEQVYTGNTLAEVALQIYFTDSRGMMGPIAGFFTAFVAPVFKGFK